MGGQIARDGTEGAARPAGVGASNDRDFLREFSRMVRRGAAVVLSKGALLDRDACGEGARLDGYWSVWSDGGYCHGSGRMMAGGRLVSPEGAEVAQFSNEVHPPRGAGATACDPCASYAEIAALEQALAVAAAAGASKLHARFDCQSILLGVAAMLTGDPMWRGVPLASKLADSARSFESLALSWVPRGQNEEADALVRRARSASEAASPSKPRSQKWALSAAWSPRSGRWLAACARGFGSKWEPPSGWGFGECADPGPGGMRDALARALRATVDMHPPKEGTPAVAVSMPKRAHEALGSPRSLLRAVGGPPPGGAFIHAELSDGQGMPDSFNDPAALAKMLWMVSYARRSAALTKAMETSPLGGAVSGGVAAGEDGRGLLLKV